jgi:hypothetical protein
MNEHSHLVNVETQYSVEQDQNKERCHLYNVPFSSHCFDKLHLYMPSIFRNI